ncbi:hypothetical protein CGRA01v4_03377 [Colletotrichum graminicola]|nr:hypothetical protein CGRA01v4_03377 [Colletotrichum graminicola]
MMYFHTPRSIPASLPRTDCLGEVHDPCSLAACIRISLANLSSMQPVRCQRARSPSLIHLYTPHPRGSPYLRYSHCAS